MQFFDKPGWFQKPPLWASPYVYAPVLVGLAYLIGSPVGLLVASYQTEGAWPARKPEQPKPPDQPKPEENRDSKPDDKRDQNPANQRDKNPPEKSGPKPLDPETLPGLFAYWPLDENMGGATRGKGEGRLSFVNGAKWVVGAKGSALEFDGKGNHVDFGAGAPLNFRAGEPFTLACWAKTEADEGAIWSFRSSDKAKPVLAALVESGQVVGWVRDDDGIRGAARVKGANIKDGKWHHIALVRYPDGNVELFLDAASQRKMKGKHSGGPITTALRTLGSDRIPMKPGVRVKRIPDFAGGIDEFCVFRRPLKAEEIAILAGKK